MREQTEHRPACDEILVKVGVNPRLSGYLYLGDALEMMVASGLIYGRSGCRWLYAGISNDRRVSMGAVEKGMRYAIEDAFERGNVDFLYELFPRDYDTGRPSNLAFLVRLAGRIYKK